MDKPRHSATSMKTFMDCPKLYYHTFVVKDVPFVESPASRRGRDVHKELEYAVNGKLRLSADFAYVQPFVENLHKLRASGALTVEAERYLRVDCGDYELAGKLDVLCQTPDKSQASLCDWKTGQVREDPFELEVHGLLVKMTWPETAMATARYYWLDSGKVGVSYSLDPAKTRVIVAQVAEAIHASAFEPWRCWRCRFCAVKECEHNASRP